MNISANKKNSRNWKLESMCEKTSEKEDARGVSSV